MKVIQQIPDMSDAALDQLERNAQEKSSTLGAQQVLKAIKMERQARRQRNAEMKAQQSAAVAEQVKDLPLVDRIVLAFRALPLSAAQIHRLQILYQHPGRNEYELAEIAGDNGPSAFNLVIGNLCSERSHYLPTPQISEKRSAPFWSGLICDLVPHEISEGRIVHRWMLKPESVEALRQLGHLS